MKHQKVMERERPIPFVDNSKNENTLIPFNLEDVEKMQDTLLKGLSFVWENVIQEGWQRIGESQIVAWIMEEEEEEEGEED